MNVTIPMLLVSIVATAVAHSERGAGNDLEVRCSLLIQEALLNPKHTEDHAPVKVWKAFPSIIPVNAGRSHTPDGARM